MRNGEVENIGEIRIVDDWEVAKVFAFARAGVRKIRFRIPTELVDKLLCRAEEFSRNSDLKISIDLISPTGNRIVTYILVGAGSGAVVGFAIGGPQGAIIGTCAGAIAGVAVAHLRITIHMDDSGSEALVVLA